jgi:hypothetical protein
MDEELKAISRTLVWWQPPEDVGLDYLTRRIMNRGTWPMVKAIERKVGEAEMKRCLATAELGEFSESAWNYWHLVFNIRPTPPLPQRTVPPSPYVATDIKRIAARPAQPLAASGAGA